MCDEAQAIINKDVELTKKLQHVEKACSLLLPLLLNNHGLMSSGLKFRALENVLVAITHLKVLVI